MTKEAAYHKVEELVTRFAEQIISYKKADYNETQTRRDFIDPFFKALGWDVDNENGYAEAYREVVHEDKVKIGKATKAPDYAFKLSGGKRLFFVEAKKPSVFIKDEILPAFQVRRYGWSAKLAISVITDFEEFAIYDCSKKPLPTDKASVARIKYLNYKDYLNEFDFIWDTFSKERVLKGSFDKYIQGTANKKGTATVDKEFLETLDNCRTMLAESIAKLNSNLNEDEINFAVQQTIDRIIFLRIAEDRSIEPYGKLQEAIKFGNYYNNLFEVFKVADDKYNSGLFNFKKDTVSKNLQIDNKALKTIVTGLYFPSPYAFEVMPVEILGSAYEQFLGKIITINKNHKAVIELKPEVRKAGGVYYTPQYIVDYIVENTVGKLTQDKIPKQVATIKILDPACGSGSFLIGAYQYLLNWHSNYYQQNPLQANKDRAFTPTGSLSTSLKKQILLNNIYGVDIDVNAVEVTKLSLLLKCMEGETDASINHQMSLFNERVLPTLDDNIKSGNSLIDTDFYDHQLDFGEEKKVKPFNWQKAFPSVFDRDVATSKKDIKLLANKAKEHAKKAMEYATEIEQILNVVAEPMAAYGKKMNGGFDVIIGNPPYFKLTSNNTNPVLLSYYQEKFIAYSGGSSKNLFQLFIEKIANLSPSIFSVIIPEAILTSESNGKTREIISERFNINSIVTFDHFVFEDATIGTTIIVGEKNSMQKTSVVKIDATQQQSIVQEINLPIGTHTWDVSFDDSSKNFFKKILDNSKLMGELVEMSKGMVVKNRNEVLTKVPVKNSLPFLLGNCMMRYNYHYEKYAVYENLEIIGGTRDYAKQTFTPRLLIRRTGSSLCATYSDKVELIESTLYILRSNKIDLKFLLGLLNSKLLTHYLSKRLVTNSQGFPQILMGQLEQLPIVETNNKKQHDQIINFVNQLLQLNQELQLAKLESQKEQLTTKIDYCEDKINELVYQLYNLTDDEIKMVTSTTK